jgi:hypothetical protein
MSKQTDKGNQYTYDGRKDKQGQSIYRQWMQTDKGNQLPTMDKQTDKGGILIALVCSSIVGILIAFVSLFVYRKYINCPCLSIIPT